MPCVTTKCQKLSGITGRKWNCWLLKVIQGVTVTWGCWIDWNGTVAEQVSLYIAAFAGSQSHPPGPPILKCLVVGCSSSSVGGHLDMMDVEERWVYGQGRGSSLGDQLSKRGKCNWGSIHHDISPDGLTDHLLPMKKSGLRDSPP